MVEHRQISVEQKDGEGFGSSVMNLGKGLWHGSIENPINGAIQTANHLAPGLHMPELDLVDSARVMQSASGRLGVNLGGVADIIGLTAAVGGFGPGSRTAMAFRAGAVGAVYAGLLQPTDASSDHFWRDRLGNAAIGGVTALAAVGTAAAVDSTGLFAVPAGRSLLGSINYGALTSAGAGLAYAETKALVKDHKAVPSWQELVNTEVNFIAVGAAGGAVGYAFNQLTNPAPKEIRLEDNSYLKAWYDKQGRPYRVQSYIDSNPGEYFDRTELTDNVLKTNNQWGRVTHYDYEGTTQSTVKVDADGTININRDFDLSFVKFKGAQIQLRPDSTFEIRTGRDSHYWEDNGKVSRIQTNEGVQEFQGGRIKSMETYTPAQFNEWKHLTLNEAGANMHYDGNNLSLMDARAAEPMPDLKVQLNPTGGYDVSVLTKNGTFTQEAPFHWSGSIQSVKPDGSALGYIEFQPSVGKPFSLGVNMNTQPVVDALRSGSSTAAATAH